MPIIWVAESPETRASRLGLLAAVGGFLRWALRGARHSDADLLAECATVPRQTLSEGSRESRGAK